MPWGWGRSVAPSSDFRTFFGAWGVEYSPDRAVIDLELAQRVELAQPAGGQNIRDYVHWLGVDKSRLNENDPVTAFLNVINFASAGGVKLNRKSGSKF